MPNEIEFLSFVPLLGREVDNPDILNLLNMAGVKTPLKTEEILENHYLELHELGLLLVFEKEGDVEKKLPYPTKNGSLVLVSVSAYGSEEGYECFRGKLPAGVNFDMSRESISDILGAPDWSSPDLPIDLWEKQDYHLLFEFQEEKPAVTLELP